MSTRTYSLTTVGAVTVSDTAKALPKYPSSISPAGTYTTSTLVVDSAAKTCIVSANSNTLSSVAAIKVLLDVFEADLNQAPGSPRSF